MSQDLRLSLRINGNQAAADMRRFTSGAAADMQRFARSATADTQRFTSAASRGLGRMSREVKSLRQDFGGFSTATKLFAAAGGLETIRRTLNTNLNFERDLLEMKQNAGMTIQQVAELRQLAMASATDTLQLPDAVVQGEKAYARAGMKFEEIKDSIVEAARSATVMRSTVEQIANMDFDLQSKFNISAKDMKAAHNMAYYHGNEGRFETAAMAQLAPVYLNALKGVGVEGMKGWNFTGALTQSIMKSAPATEPSQVATLIQQGVGHIAAYAKDLGKAGINVKQYGPKGQFGVEGLLKLAEVMKAKGLNDIFKLEKAGIRDQEAKKFWLQMMNDSAEIRKQMGVAEQAAQGDRIGADLAEIKTASFGKIMASEIQIQKMALSDGAQKGTTVAGNIAGYASEHVGDVAKGAASLGALTLLARFNGNRKDRLAGEMAVKTGGAAPLAQIPAQMQNQSVFVTNWPASMMSPGEKIRSKTGGNGALNDEGLGRRSRVNGDKAPSMGKANSAAQNQSVFVTNWPASMSSKAGGYDNQGAKGAPSAPMNEGPAKTSKLGQAGKALGAVGAVMSGWEMGQAIGGVAKELIDSTVQAVTGQESATLGTAIYDMLHKSKIDTGGELHIKIDAPSPVTVTSMKTKDPRMNLNVDSGLTMSGAR